jgi:hypothetical protein
MLGGLVGSGVEAVGAMDDAPSPNRTARGGFCAALAYGETLSGNYGFAPWVRVTIIRLAARSFQTSGLTCFWRRHGSCNGNGRRAVRHVCRQHGVLFLPARTLSVPLSFPFLSILAAPLFCDAVSPCRSLPPVCRPWAQQRACRGVTTVSSCGAMHQNFLKRGSNAWRCHSGQA